MSPPPYAVLVDRATLDDRGVAVVARRAGLSEQSVRHGKSAFIYVDGHVDASVARRAGQGLAGQGLTSRVVRTTAAPLGVWRAMAWAGAANVPTVLSTGIAAVDVGILVGGSAAALLALWNGARRWHPWRQAVLATRAWEAWQVARVPDAPISRVLAAREGGAGWPEPQRGEVLELTASIADAVAEGRVAQPALGMLEDVLAIGPGVAPARVMVVRQVVEAG